MRKKSYIIPRLEVVILDAVDIIATSSQGNISIINDQGFQEGGNWDDL